jgi:hypothetical protein
MDHRESIRRLSGGYVDWYGRPATEAQYLDYQRKVGVKDIHLDAQKSADEQKAYFAAHDGVIDDGEDWLFIKVAETGIPHQDKLLAFLGADATLGNLPGTKKRLQEAPGIGPKGVETIAAWMLTTYGVTIA